jgi:hypothetical protein
MEQAHNPLRMNYSVAELFDIVPSVKNRQDLFKSISDFLQHQLLAQIELERRLVDAMGQFTEAEFLSPLQPWLREFSDRYVEFERIHTQARIRPRIRIASLLQFHWKNILARGALFSKFDRLREAVEIEYAKLHEKTNLICCDPSSVIELKLVLDGRSLLSLFNSAQFAAVRLIFEQLRSLEWLSAWVTVDDLPEQLATLVAARLLIEG